MEGTYGALAYISQWGKVGKVEKRTGTVSGETCDVTVQDAGDREEMKLPKEYEIIGSYKLW